MNNYVPPDKRLSLATCKKILKKNGVQHTDEEIIKIRDWFYVLADIAIDAIDKNDPNYVKQKKEHSKSNALLK
jgi:hypothetical protein